MRKKGGVMVQHIYKIINTKNNKFYMGRSLHPDKRLNKHLNTLKRGVHDNIYLQRAWMLIVSILNLK